MNAKKSNAMSQFGMYADLLLTVAAAMLDTADQLPKRQRSLARALAGAVARLAEEAARIAQQ